MLVELLAAAVAVVLTVVIVVSQLRAAPESRAAGQGRGDRAAAPTTGAAAPTTGAGPPSSAAPPRAGGNLLADPGFEAGLGRWRAGAGTRLERVADPRSGAWAASLSAGGSSAPAMRIGEAGRCRAGKRYAVTVWLRASHPGTLVRVDLAEQSGGRRYAVDTAGAALGGQGWQPLEVRHVTHRPGAQLAIEIAAAELPGGGRLLVDDLTLRESPGPPRP